MKQLIPKPNGIYEEKEGRLDAKLCTNVWHGCFSQKSTSAFFARMDYDFSEAAEEAAGLRLVLNEDLGAEAYKLHVDGSGAEVHASTDIGVIWALTSLFSLLDDHHFPFVTIEDSPRYSHRGFLLDCARHFFPVAVVKKVIEQNALVKLNTLHWHLTDDQGWRIESNVFPELHSLNNQPYYTQDEIRGVVAFAALRGVEVIPEIDMPGHTLAAISALPHLSCKEEKTSPADKGGIYKTILCAGKDETYSFARKIIDEVCTLFESKYFHIGGDEAPKDEWENCPHCCEKRDAVGAVDFDDLQGFFTKELGDYLASKGKIPMVWNEVLSAEKRPQPLVVQHWLEIGDADNTRAFIKNGGKVIISDMFSLYLDYPEFFTSLRRIYEFTPMIKGESFADHEGVLGIQACLWSERVFDAEILYKRIYPRLFAVAEAAWTYDRDYDDFETSLESKISELESKNITYQSIEDSNPIGAERVPGVMAFVTAFSTAAEEGSAPAMTPEMMQQFLMGFGIELPR